MKDLLQKAQKSLHKKVINICQLVQIDFLIGFCMGKRPDVVLLDDFLNGKRESVIKLFCFWCDFNYK